MLGPTEADGQFSVNWISDSDYSVLACRCREINVNTPPLPSILHGGGEGFIICNLHIASFRQLRSQHKISLHI